MKEGKNNKSRKHLKNSDSDDRATLRDSDKYKNVLKERHYREVSESDKKEKKRQFDSKQDIKNSKKDKGRSTQVDDHHNHHRLEEEHKRDRKHGHSLDESYEELARKKRKIQSALHALDLEEAAEREAKKKVVNRKAPDPKRRKNEQVCIKEEPLSDDDNRRRNSKSTTKQSKSGIADDRNQRRPQTSKSSDGEGRWGNPQVETKKSEKVKEKPDFSVSGKLAEDTNTYNGVVIKYNEPSEARKPRRRWRLYPFKGDTDLPFIPIHRQSAYLFGRQRSIADIPIDHPSCSKQHAVLQFRLIPYKREDNTTGRRVRPYIIDLESSNGTFVNNKKIDPRCYVELMEKDVVKFGFSSREYVILHEESKNDEEDDDVLDSN